MSTLQAIGLILISPAIIIGVIGIFLGCAKIIVSAYHLIFYSAKEDIVLWTIIASTILFFIGLIVLGVDDHLKQIPQSSIIEQE